VCSGASGSAERLVLVPVPVQQPRVQVQVRVRVLGQGQAQVPAQGPLVRPGLRVFRRVAVVLAFLSLSFFFI